MNINDGDMPPPDAKRSIDEEALGAPKADPVSPQELVGADLSKAIMIGDQVRRRKPRRNDRQTDQDQ